MMPCRTTPPRTATVRERRSSVTICLEVEQEAHEKKRDPRGGGEVRDGFNHDPDAPLDRGYVRERGCP